MKHLRLHGKKYAVAALITITVKLGLMMGSLGVAVILAVSTLMTDFDWESL